MMRWKPLLWVFGVALLACSLVAANRLLDGSKRNEGPAELVATPTILAGPTLLGTFDSDPPMLRIDPPGIVGLPALSIKKVLVREGDIVNIGDILVQFDDSTFSQNAELVKKKLAAAEVKLRTAQLQKDDFPNKIKQQTLALSAAKDKHTAAVTKRDLAYKNAEAAAKLPTFGGGATPTAAQVAERLKNNQELISADAEVELLNKAVEKEKNDLDRLDTVRTLNELEYQLAKIDIESVNAALEQAKLQIESFKLKAMIAGQIEQIMASDGMTFSPATRTTMMYLVPSGKRVVRAEVEAEFASKVNAQEGKSVTIYDSYDFSNTYSGVVRRLSSAFLPKRFGADSLVASPTRVLECTIDVPDPRPKGRVPLRPGQPVRVTFGG